MAPANYSIATISEFVGRELGFRTGSKSARRVSISSPNAPAITNGFMSTGSGQPGESPYGGTIAHGFVSIAGAIPISSLALPRQIRDQLLNYGLDRVRFMAPVKAGVRVRNRVELIAADAKGPGRVLIKTRKHHRHRRRRQTGFGRRTADDAHRLITEEHRPPTPNSGGDHGEINPDLSPHGFIRHAFIGHLFGSIR